MRKYTLGDIDMEGKRVVIRLNMNAILSEEEWYEEEQPPEEGEDLEDEEAEPRVIRHCEPRVVIEAPTIEIASDTIKYCLDHLAKCVIIIGDIGPGCGEYREE